MGMLGLTEVRWLSKVRWRSKVRWPDFDKATKDSGFGTAAGTLELILRRCLETGAPSITNKETSFKWCYNIGDGFSWYLIERRREESWFTCDTVCWPCVEVAAVHPNHKVVFMFGLRVGWGPLRPYSKTDWRSVAIPSPHCPLLVLSQQRTCFSDYFVVIEGLF